MDANLVGAKIDPIAAAQLSIVPEVGAFIGWKKCRGPNGNGKVIVKLQIPATAKRSNATGRKCRAERAKVMAIYNMDGTEAEYGISSHDRVTKYVKGKTVKCHEWEEARWVECAGGIHFFITRTEAEAY